VALQQIMVKVAHRSNTFCLAFGSEAELTWESLWLQVAGRFELLPGGEAMADAIYAGSAIFTYVDADGDSVQLVCEADLAIAVRSASVSSPPTLRLLVELARTGGSAGEADRSGSGEGGEGGAGGSGKPAPERYERCPQPWAPGPQPQGDGRSSPSGGGGMAGGQRSTLPVPQRCCARRSSSGPVPTRRCWRSGATADSAGLPRPPVPLPLQSKLRQWRPHCRRRRLCQD
jgi:hypothetical protein